MDNKIIKAFRLRLKRAGFTFITIYDNCNGTYAVQCNKGDLFYSRRMTTEEIINTPHLVWFD